MKQKKAVFWLEGRSETWKRLDRGIKKTMAYRQRQYEEKMTKRLEDCGKTGQWYSIYQFFTLEDMPQRWNITELQPDQSPQELADQLSSYFIKITNMSKSLIRENIPVSQSGVGLIPQLVPRELMNPCAGSLAKAFTHIYNASFLTK